MYIVDTYAFIEWFVYENENYKDYFKEIRKKGGFTTELVLIELYHKIFHKKGRKKADMFFEIVTSYFRILDLNTERIKNTGKIRSKMLKDKKQLSYTDCLNLAVGRELDLRVLTGDKEFKDVRGVEFVK